MASASWLRVITLYSFLVLTCLWQDVLVSGESEVITEENSDIIFKGHWMIKFYAPWCPACRNVKPIWDKFAIEAESLNVQVAEVDVTKNSALSGRFGIVSLPTVYHAINGEFRLYNGRRRFDEFVAFIEERQWEDIEAIPSWKSPGSILMRALGLVYKVSVVFKDIHTILTEKYGLPAWGSYVIFGVGTVLVGLILGMVLVFISDVVIGMIWPAAAAVVVKVDGTDTAEGSKEDTDADQVDDGAVEQDATDATNLRKRGKKLKATME